MPTIFSYLLLNPMDKNPDENLESVLSSIGLCFRRISGESEISENEYGLVLYDYTVKRIDNSFGMKRDVLAPEIHLVRIEPNSIWTHKFGWGNETSITSPQEIHDRILELDDVDVAPLAFFAIWKPQ